MGEERRGGDLNVTSAMRGEIRGSGEGAKKHIME